MKKLAYLLIILVMAYGLFGCAAAGRLIDYSSMKTDVAMSESIFLTPTDAPKTMYIQVKNTSSNQMITSLFESTIVSNIQSRGYKLVQKPSQATYILQVNCRYLGEWKQGIDFSGTLTGTGIGALAGLGMSGYQHRTSGTLAGGLIGGALGFVADIATRVRTEIIVIEFQITERLSEEQDIIGQEVEEVESKTEIKSLGGLGTQQDTPSVRSSTRKVSSKKKGVNIYNAGVAARAAQVNLNVQEATQRLIETAGQQIAGIF